MAEDFAFQIKREKELHVSDKQISFFQDFLSGPGVVFNVGANTGNRTKIFRKLGKKTVAVEPLLECSARLAALFRDDPDVVIVTAALGSKMDFLEILKPEYSVIASMSKEWINAVSKERFSASRWDEKYFVPVLTLDILIEKFGLPSFIKIDVEGYEHEVLKGLSQAVPAMCFEFTPELFELSSKCVEKIQSLGRYEWNVSLDESFEFHHQNWISAPELLDYLRALESDKHVFGDIYCRIQK